MEQTSTILTIKDVAEILRCSKAHVANVLGGKVPGIPRLTHIAWAVASWYEKNG